MDIKTIRRVESVLEVNLGSSGIENPTLLRRVLTLIGDGIDSIRCIGNRIGRGREIDLGTDLNTLRTGLDKLADLSHVIVSGLKVNGLVDEITNDRCVAIVLDVVWSSDRIENHVPVRPSNSPELQVGKDVLSVSLSTFPITENHAWAVASLFSTCFAVHQSQKDVQLHE